MKNRIKRQTGRRIRRNDGFTMAELLIVVAILGVLAGVSFVAVQRYQTSTTRLQYDTIAKEIFVAAQNHLTLAKSENYQDTAELPHTRGTAGNAEADRIVIEGTPGAFNDDIYYFNSSEFTANGSSILDQMLPFGSVELVSGGSFIIRYQPNAARVLDVFYWTDDNRYGIGDADDVEYKKAVEEYRDSGGTDNKNNRLRYNGVNNHILGWCGGEDVVDSGSFLAAPTIEVINAERLLVKVTDPNILSTDAALTALKPMLKLFIIGRTSKAVAFMQLTNSSSTIHSKLTEPLDPDSSRLSNVEEPPLGEEYVTYTIVLDDITAPGLHFSQLNSGIGGTISDGYLTIKYDTTKTDPFIPGENIDIYAVAYSNAELSNIAYSGTWTTNSLFGEVTGTDTAADTVYISNMRHLENLNNGISSFGYNASYFSSTINVVQNTDLIWKDTDAATSDFVSTLKVDKGTEQSGANTVTVDAIYVYDDTIPGGGTGPLATKVDSFMPVSVTAGKPIVYNGQSSHIENGVEIRENHSISGVKVDNTTDPDNPDADGTNTMVLSSGGVFGSLTSATIKNLRLVDTSVNCVSSSNCDAGTLAGTLIASRVENVVAYNTSTFETALKTSDPTITTVRTAVGNAGGLVGSITKTDVVKSAASVVVNAIGGNAGGLIGNTTATVDNMCNVTGCYSGGHTENDGLTGSNSVVHNKTNYNVTAAASGSTGGTAGGLIGDAGATAIKYSYSTCSATGATVGGLIGNATGSIQYSYCTGLVKSTAATPVEGAFAGTWTYTGQATTDGNSYFEIINERKETYTNASGAAVETGGYIYLDPVSGSETVTGITAMDATASTFNKFSNPGTTGYTWQSAIPYNDTLTKYYGEGSGTSREAKYILKTVAQLALLDSLNTEFAVQGEPATTDNPRIPADFVATHYGDWPAPEIFVVNTAS